MSQNTRLYTSAETLNFLRFDQQEHGMEFVAPDQHAVTRVRLWMHENGHPVRFTPDDEAVAFELAEQRMRKL